MINQTIAGLLDGANSVREWKNLELTPTMIDGAGADTGGVNSLPHGKMAWIPGTPAMFVFAGAVRKKGDTWDDCYAFERLTTSPLNAVYFGLQIDFAFPLTTINNRRPFELELDYCEKGLSYNMAWQFKMNTDDGGPGWRMFNMKTQTWEFFPGLPPVAPQPGKFVSVAAHFFIDRDSQTCTHDSLQVDGQLFSINVRHTAVHRFSPTTNQLVHALQWDSDGKGTPLNALVKNYHVRCI
jgi:hypothetical protein